MIDPITALFSGPKPTIHVVRTRRDPASLCGETKGTFIQPTEGFGFLYEPCPVCLIVLRACEKRNKAFKDARARKGKLRLV